MPKRTVFFVTPHKPSGWGQEIGPEEADQYPPPQNGGGEGWEAGRQACSTRHDPHSEQKSQTGSRTLVRLIINRVTPAAV